MKIAIIGGGITGITLAWLLSGLGKIVVYEKNSRLATGHSSLEHSLDNSTGGLSTASTASTASKAAANQTASPANTIDKIDRGIPLFFPYYQTELASLFEYLDIYTEPRPLSYRSYGKFPFKMAAMPAAGLSFKKLAPITNNRISNDVQLIYRSLVQDYKQKNVPTNLTLRQYIRGLKVNDNSIHEAIYPVISALWNYSPDAMKDFSASKYMKFINRSKLLDPKVSDQVRYLPESMDKYLSKLLFKGSFEYLLNTPVAKVKYSNSMVNITDANKARKSFDRVIITCSPKDAREIIDPEIATWQDTLSKLEGHDFPVFIHRDAALLKEFGDSVMGSSITYALNTRNTAYHYNLGIINKLPKDSPYYPLMMSINLPNKPSNIIHESRNYRPGLDVVTTRYYREISAAQGNAGVYYCTDGLNPGTSPMTGGINAAIRFAKELGVELPFSTQ